VAAEALVAAAAEANGGRQAGLRLPG
jgi:hypothetical protein